MTWIASWLMSLRRNAGLTEVLTVHPTSALNGAIHPPGDKSISHRSALLAAIASGQSKLENFLQAGVTEKMLSALSRLGVEWHFSANALIVTGKGLDGLEAPLEPIDCGHSATSMRMVAGLAAAAGLAVVLDGSPGLRRRPMERIVAPLQRMGVPVRSRNGRAPLVFERRTAGELLRGGTFPLPIASAQVKTCLLLAALAAREPVTVIEPGRSRDHTELLMAGLGRPLTRWQEAPDERFPHGRYFARLDAASPFNLPPLSLTVPGDFSSAAFLIVAALITPESQVSLEGVGLNPTRTGLLDALTAMGAEIEIEFDEQAGLEPIGRITAHSSHLIGNSISGEIIVRMIDELPILAVAAACAHGPTTVSDAGELRYKESDRIGDLVRMLRQLGIAIDERPDGFFLPGGTPPIGGRIQPAGDHRLALAAAVAGLASRDSVVVEEDGIIAESFPGFQSILKGLGARLDAG